MHFPNAFDSKLLNESPKFKALFRELSYVAYFLVAYKKCQRVMYPVQLSWGS